MSVGIIVNGQAQGILRQFNPELRLRPASRVLGMVARDRDEWFAAQDRMRTVTDNPDFECGIPTSAVKAKDGDTRFPNQTTAESDFPPEAIKGYASDGYALLDIESAWVRRLVSQDMRIVAMESVPSAPLFVDNISHPSSGGGYSWECQLDLLRRIKGWRGREKLWINLAGAPHRNLIADYEKLGPLVRGVVLETPMRHMAPSEPNGVLECLHAMKDAGLEIVLASPGPAYNGGYEGEQRDEQYRAGIAIRHLGEGAHVSYLWFINPDWADEQRAEQRGEPQPPLHPHEWTTWTEADIPNITIDHVARTATLETMEPGTGGPI